MSATWVVAPSGLIEPVMAPEVYVDGIGAIELIDSGNIRIHLVCEQLPLEAACGVPQKVVVAKIVGPVLNVPLVIGQLAMCLWKPVKEPPPRSKPRLV